VKKRGKSSRDKWNELVELGRSADVEQVAYMSEAEVDAELAKEGFDVDELDRIGQAEHDAAVRAEERESRRKQRVAPANPWLAVPAGVLVAAGMVVSMGAEVVTVGQGAKEDAGAISVDAGPDGD
jgi:hypothetical protein